MKLPVLASFIIILAIISRLIKKSSRAMDAEQQSFWSKEQESNSVRKKSLDGLNYVTIPFDKLPCEVHKDHPLIAECLSTLQTLSERKIVNLTGVTNTDLKLTYGTANITVLTEYDQNFTVLVTTLQKWAEALYDLDAVAEAQTVLEYAVSVDSDVTTSYELLASVYATNQNPAGIEELIKHAQELTSSSGKIIVRKLQESYMTGGNL